MSVDQLKKLFEINQYAFGVNVEGLSHGESLIQPGGGGNCLNWVAGHVVANRNHILELLAESPIWDEPAYAEYKRGSAPIGEGAKARPFESIVTDFGRAQERIQAGLARLHDADLSAPRGKQTLGETLHFLHFHEAYHIGQTALLRRLAGKPGAIP
jgi:uncharacterized damage-inducible protein DinB